MRERMASSTPSHRHVAPASIGAFFKAKFAHFAVKRGPADTKPLGDLGHVPAIAPECQTDHVRFDRFERANLAALGYSWNADRSFAAGGWSHREGMGNGVLGSKHGRARDDRASLDIGRCSGYCGLKTLNVSGN